MANAYYNVTLKTRTPIILANRPSNGEGSMFHSLDFLTGASIRGAFIQLWKQSYGLSQEKMTMEVQDKFMEEGFVFENFYTTKSSPLPLTAITCKQFPGFKTQEDGHGVRDSLIHYYLNKKSFDIEQFQCRDGENQCQSTLQTYEKLVKATPGHTESGAVYHVADSIQKIQSGHVAIDPITQTNIKGQLYFENAVDINETFSGSIHVPPSYQKEFEETFKTGSILRIGAKRTSGFGEIEVHEVREAKKRVLTSLNPGLRKSLKDRWETFQKTCEKLNVISDQEDAFSLTFMSDAILVDEFYRYRSGLTSELLGQLSGYDLPPAELVNSHVESKSISGWNQMWNTAVDDVTAVKLGSSYLFITKKDKREEWISYLEKLESNGIGERKYAGFGQVITCHPFHLQLEEV